MALTLLEASNVGRGSGQRKVVAAEPVVKVDYVNNTVEMRCGTNPAAAEAVNHAVYDELPLVNGHIFLSEDEVHNWAKTLSVPINDIYKVFQSYWQQGANNLVYTSITESNISGSVENAGRRNGMWFQSGENLRKYTFNKNGTNKTGYPINCSSLAGLVALGIPYDKSRYTINSKAKYTQADSTYGYTFNMYGDNVVIDHTNYNSYFKADRQLSRCRELGLEIPALHLEWKTKPLKSNGKPAGTWYDIITPHSDLREAQPGDLIFWNNDGDSEADPRKVSHVVLVLARLSYDSRNPNQPLLLLAEATAASKTEVQICYYIYDDRGLYTISKNNDGDYIKLNSQPEDLYYRDGEANDYAADEYRGQYLSLEGNSYVQVINDFYIKNTASVKKARYTRKRVEDNWEYTQNNNGNYIRYYHLNGDNKPVLKYHSLNCSDSSAVYKYKAEKIEGTNEHKIPKFICRPKYKRLTSVPYKDISEMKNIGNSDYKVTTDSNNYKIEIKNTDINQPELITLEFDWKTPDDYDAEFYFRLMGQSGSTEVVAMRFYIPDVQRNTKYSNVRLIVPINAWVSSSKGTNIAKTSNIIKLQVVTKKNDGSTSNSQPKITDLKVYRGLRLT